MTARILIVDDIFPNVKLLEAKLSGEYFDVITALSGPEGIQKAETMNPDLIHAPGPEGYIDRLQQ